MPSSVSAFCSPAYAASLNDWSPLPPMSYTTPTFVSDAGAGIDSAVEPEGVLDPLSSLSSLPHPAPTSARTAHSENARLEIDR